MVNFRVGNRVEVVNSGSSILKNGDIGTITLIESNVAKVFVNGKPNNGNWIKFESLKLIPTDKQRIETLEKRVEELEKLVGDYFKVPVEPSTDDVEVIEFEGNKYRKVDRKAREGDVVTFDRDVAEKVLVITTSKPYLVRNGYYRPLVITDDSNFEQRYIYFWDFNPSKVYELIPSFTTYEGQDLEAEYAEQVKVEKTPNQLRAEIIEKAKGFVEESKRELSNNRGKGYVIPFGDDPELGGYICDLDFVVNDEKRTVVALLTWNPLCEDAKIKGRGIAKCNPSDVFNEHIGKAIALGRALGLDVSEFEGAVQPTEVVVGMVVRSKHDGEIVELSSIRKAAIGVLGCKNAFNIKGEITWIGDNQISEIINDTNAIYGEVE